MISLTHLFFLLVIHYVGDFVFQTQYQASNKSSKLEALITHTSVYSAAFLLFAFVTLPTLAHAIAFITITFVAHTLTDAITSRVNKYFWAKKKERCFFMSLGLDQLLHGLQLVFTFYLLNQWIS